MPFIMWGSNLKKIGTGLGAAAFWLVLWQLAYNIIAQEILLVSPVQAVMRLFSLMGEQLFWRSVLLTCLRVVVGFVVALILGTVIAAAGARFRLLHHLLAPLMGVVRATPVASFIILALVWLSGNRVPIFIVILMGTPMVWSNVYAGIVSADKGLLEMAAVFRFSRMKIFRYIYVPAVVPYLGAAISTSLGFAWKSAIAAEIIALPKLSVGKQLYNAKIYLDTADLFAWTVAVILISLAVERLALWLVSALSRRLGGQGLEGGGGDVSAH